MNWNDVKPWIAKFAPMVGTALGGPFGALAGAAVGQALGIKDAKPEDVAAAIKTGTLDGPQILELKKAEDEFKLEMAKLGIDSTQALEELAFKDRDSARNREIQVKDWTPRILAYSITVGFFGILIFMLRAKAVGAGADLPYRDVLNVMVGALGTAWISVVTYYFGSSAGSKAKDVMLYNSQPAKE